MNNLIYKSCVFIGVVTVALILSMLSKSIGYQDGYDAGYAARDAEPRPLPSRHEVRQWQRELKERGIYDGPIDAKIGPKMKAAIEVFWMTYPYMQGEKDRGEQNE